MHGSPGVVRVLIADDSDVAAAALEIIVEQDPTICVVGRAANGRELLDSPMRSGAQVIIVDLLMPELGGLSVLSALAHAQPVIVVSSVDADSKIAAEALALGAIGYFSKRDLNTPLQSQRLRETIKRAVAPISRPRSGRSVLSVVGSTGAIPFLERLIRDLVHSDLSILVVQHLPSGKEELLVELLRGHGARARIATDGLPLDGGVLIAPTDRHLAVDATRRARLIAGPPVKGHLPSGQVLFDSLRSLANNSVAVMLAGLGDDGAQGMAALADLGVPCFALDPRDCQVAFMPEAAIAASARVRPVRATALAKAVQEVVSHG